MVVVEFRGVTKKDETNRQNQKKKHERSSRSWRNLTRQILSLERRVKHIVFRTKFFLLLRSPYFNVVVGSVPKKAHRLYAKQFLMTWQSCRANDFRYVREKHLILAKSLCLGRSICTRLQSVFLSASWFFILFVVISIALLLPLHEAHPQFHKRYSSRFSFREEFSNALYKE